MNEEEESWLCEFTLHSSSLFYTVIHILYIRFTFNFQQEEVIPTVSNQSAKTSLFYMIRDSLLALHLLPDNASAG